MAGRRGGGGAHRSSPQMVPWNLPAWSKPQMRDIIQRAVTAAAVPNQRFGRICKTPDSDSSWCPNVESPGALTGPLHQILRLHALQHVRNLDLRATALAASGMVARRFWGGRFWGGHLAAELLQERDEAGEVGHDVRGGDQHLHHTTRSD